MEELIDKLASSQGRRDQVPNMELAQEIIKTENGEDVKTLVSLLKHKEKHINSDAIKTLYEIGAQKPRLIAPYITDFADLLTLKNNRMIWGGMTALASVALEVPEQLIEHIPAIVKGMEKGSVIAKDRGITALAKLASIPAYSEQTFVFLLEELWKTKPLQFPMYAEIAMIAVNDKNKGEFLHLLTQRMGDLEKESQRKRVNKIIRKLGKS